MLYLFLFWTWVKLKRIIKLDYMFKFGLFSCRISSSLLTSYLSNLFFFYTLKTPRLQKFTPLQIFSNNYLIYYSWNYIIWVKLDRMISFMKLKKKKKNSPTLDDKKKKKSIFYYKWTIYIINILQIIIWYLKIIIKRIPSNFKIYINIFLYMYTYK